MAVAGVVAKQKVVEWVCVDVVVLRFVWVLIVAKVKNVVEVTVNVMGRCIDVAVVV